MTKPRALVLEDSSFLAGQVLDLLRRRGFACVWHVGLEPARQACSARFDAYIIDVRVRRTDVSGEANGLDLAEEVRLRNPSAVVIVVSNGPSDATRARIAALGCHYVEKDTAMQNAIGALVGAVKGLS